MMDDRFMHELEREPRPAFARGLRERLRADETNEREPRGALARLAPVLAPVLGVAAVASLFLFPSVRASAQAFLDLFRIRTFTAVTVDAARMKQLESGNLDLKSLISQKIQTVKDPGPPQVVASAQLAGASAGFIVKTPMTLPAGLVADTVTVRGASEANLTIDTTQLKRVLETLDIRDLQIPAGIDGRTVDVKMAPVVEQRFRNDRRRAHLLETKGPEIGLPSGLDLPKLAEIGLRILGLEPGEARRIAQSTDWRSTMLVPVPGDVGSFRQVDVKGQKALLVTTTGTTPDGRRRDGAIVLWSDGDMVYALAGNIDSLELMQMANSIP
jgi:hypothetical protein